MKKATNILGYNQQAPTKKNICAIVVTYHPDGGLAERIKCTAKQVDKVIVVDNNSGGQCLKMIKKMSDKLGSYLILNSKNLGIATALNQGIKYACSCGYVWALTLDQDSVPFPKMVQYLKSAYQECPYRQNVGIIGTNFEEQFTGKDMFSYKDFKGSQWMEVETAITSGSLLNIPLFNVMGCYRDDFFIDLVDFEYCLRIREKSYKVIIARNIGMIHSHGKGIAKKIMWKNIKIHDYPPLRSYYRTRNGLILIRRYFRKNPDWALSRIKFLFRRLISVIIIENDKLSKLKYMFLGLYHALLFTTGKLKCQNSENN